MTIFVLQGKPAVNLSKNGVTIGNVKYIGKNMINQAKIAHYSSLVE